jgi:hypothetical protein
MVEQFEVKHEDPGEHQISQETQLSEHELEMIEKASGVPTEPQKPQEDKFGGDYQKLKQSYEELQKKYTQDNQNEEAEYEDEDLGLEEDSGLEITAEQQENLAKSGIDVPQIQEEYSKNGKLSDKTYKDLESKGLPKDIVDNYISGQEARAAIIGNQVKDTVGGNEAYGEMVNWAKLNYSPEQLEAYNNTVNTGSLQAIIMAAKALKADYTEANGEQGEFYEGETPRDGDFSGDVFRSNDELVRAMADSKYQTDPAYRQDIEDKLKRSDLFAQNRM